MPSITILDADDKHEVVGPVRCVAEVGLSPALGAAMGLVAVVAAASNTPISAILMGVELPGGQSTICVADAAIAAYLIVGHRSVYLEQQLAPAKRSWLTARTDIPVSQEKVRLSGELVNWWREHRKPHPPNLKEPPEERLQRKSVKTE